jgi:hypothetical protein
VPNDGTRSCGRSLELVEMVIVLLAAFSQCLKLLSQNSKGIKCLKYSVSFFSGLSLFSSELTISRFTLSCSKVSGSHFPLITFFQFLSLSCIA